MIKMYHWYKVTRIISDSERVLGLYGIVIDKKSNRFLLYFPKLITGHMAIGSDVNVNRSSCWWVNVDALEEVNLIEAL